MLPWGKLIKIGLPVATATTTAIITSYLIALQHKDSKNLNEEEQLLENIEAKTEDFKEEKIEQSLEEVADTEQEPKENSPEEKKEPEATQVENPDKAALAAVQKTLNAMSEQKDTRVVDEMKINTDDLIAPEVKQLSTKSDSSWDSERTRQDGLNQPSIPKLDSPIQEEETAAEEASAQQSLDNDQKEGLNSANENIVETSERDLLSKEHQETTANGEANQTLKNELPTGEDTGSETEEIDQIKEEAGESEGDPREHARGEKDSTENKGSREGDSNEEGNSEITSVNIEEMESLLDSLGAHKNSLGFLLSKSSR